MSKIDLEQADKKRNVQSDQALLIDVLLTLWRLRNMADNSDLGQRVDSTVERLELKLQQAGFTLLDKTGEFFDPGMPLRVLTSVSQPGIGRPTILETVAPAIFKANRLLRPGEIIVGLPQETEEEQT